MQNHYINATLLIMDRELGKGAYQALNNIKGIGITVKYTESNDQLWEYARKGEGDVTILAVKVKDIAEFHHIIDECNMLESHNFIYLVDIDDKSLVVGGNYISAYQFVFSGRSMQDVLVGLIKAFASAKSTEYEFYPSEDYILKNGKGNNGLHTFADKRYLFTELEKFIKKAKSTGSRLALLFLHIRNIRSINANLGHEYGDVLLKTVSNRLNKIAIKSVFSTRFTGGSFILILDEILNDNELMKALETIQTAVVQPVMLANRRHAPLINIGVSLYPKDADSPHGLIDKACNAAFQASEEGFNTYQFYSKQAVSYHFNKMLENDLLTAIKNNEFQLVYQPEFSANSGRIVGIESLIRWNNPRFGLMLPDSFIPVAERSDLIKAISEWVLDEAFSRFSDWRILNKIKDEMFISVNISFKQILRTGFFEMINECAKRHSLPTYLIHLELTESALVENLSLGALELTRLKEKGFKIIVDDFGTGYSSLSYISALPIDGIKLDRSFTKNCDNQITKKIIQSIIHLSHELKLTVTAEGVETQEQYDWLTSQGCDIFQGFYLSHPLTEKNLMSLLSCI